MPKRSDKHPYRRSPSEQRIDNQRHYDKLEDKPSKIKAIFLERPHYGIQEPKYAKEVNHVRGGGKNEVN